MAFSERELPESLSVAFSPVSCTFFRMATERKHFKVSTFQLVEVSQTNSHKSTSSAAQVSPGKDLLSGVSDLNSELKRFVKEERLLVVVYAPRPSSSALSSVILLRFLIHAGDYELI